MKLNNKKVTMKTKTLLLVAIISTFSLSIFASDPITSNNIIKTEKGSIKETTFFHEGSKKLSKKAICNYNLEEQLMEKIVYQWKGSKGWIALQKFEYTYASSQSITPMSVVHTRWDVKNRCWSKNNNTTKY